MMKDIYLFSHRLKRARKLKKLTQAGLAKKLYVSKSTEQRWEEAIRVPNKEMLERISMVLDVDIDYLLGLQNRRRANSLKEYQQNCIANSNALHSTSGTFAELSANAKRLLGLSTKKALYC